MLTYAQYKADDAFKEYSKLKLYIALFNLFILDKILFCKLDLPEFRYLIHLCHSNTPIPSYQFFPQAIPYIYDKAVKQIRSILSLDCKIALVLDIWTSQNNITFIVIIDSFMTDD